MRNYYGCLLGRFAQHEMKDLQNKALMLFQRVPQDKNRIKQDMRDFYRYLFERLCKDWSGIRRTMLGLKKTEVVAALALPQSTIDERHDEGCFFFF